jgi:hypothetical protein
LTRPKGSAIPLRQDDSCSLDHLVGAAERRWRDGERDSRNENAEVFDRVHDLARVPAAVRFISCEPLIGPLEGLPLASIHWVIVGGESGPRARPMNEQWVESIFAQCRRANVHFFSNSGEASERISLAGSSTVELMTRCHRWPWLRVAAPRSHRLFLFMYLKPSKNRQSARRPVFCRCDGR